LFDRRQHGETQSTVKQLSSYAVKKNKRWMIRNSATRANLDIA